MKRRKGSKKSVTQECLGRLARQPPIEAASHGSGTGRFFEKVSKAR